MDQENLLATPFTVSLISRCLIFAVPDQSAKNAKIMCLENLALYSIANFYSIFGDSFMNNEATAVKCSLQT